MAYQEPKKRTIRLDDDVYEALKKLPESPNKFLRKVLNVNEAGGLVVHQLGKDVQAHQATLRAKSRPHMIHSGVRPVEGCEQCVALKT